MRNYDGWTIRSGYLTGNLGDVRPEVYERHLREALERAYPGAVILTPSQDGSGVPPCGLDAAAWAPGDGPDSAQDVESEVERIADAAWTAACADPAAYTG